MRRTSTFLTALLLAATSAAAPVQQGFKKTLPTEDGSLVTAELCGDEFMSWWETNDGSRYTVTADGKSFVKADFKSMQANARAMRARIDEEAKAPLGGEHITYTGKKKGLIILVDFPDRKFADSHTRDYYDKIANEPGLSSEEGYIGSVHDYYLAQSNGLFDLSFDVVGPYTMPNGYAYYGANSEKKHDVNLGEMIKTATDQAAPSLNLAEYDWDGDGTADQVFVLYAGVGENASDDADAIWACMNYMSLLGGAPSYTTGSINRFACASELLGVMEGNAYTDKTRISGIGTICHEFSHCLGFPDTYDVNGQKQYGMGYYDLLSNGNYLGGGLTPPNFTAWERVYAGWVEPIELKSAANVNKMVSSSDYGQPFIIYNDNNHDEYYLLENRQKTGWDRNLYGKGLMVTHVDYDKTRWAANKVNASGQDHQRMTLIHADNDDIQNKVSSVRGDLYPYTSKDGSEIYNDMLTDTSTPAATLWNSNAPDKGTTFMGKPITNIARDDNDGTVSFKFMGGDDNNVIANGTLSGINTVEAGRHKDDKTVYSLDGRRVNVASGCLPKGIYIVGGKKMIK